MEASQLSIRIPIERNWENTEYATSGRVADAVTSDMFVYCILLVHCMVRPPGTMTITISYAQSINISMIIYLMRNIFTQISLHIQRANHKSAAQMRRTV
jgi:hypothetical protein